MPCCLPHRCCHSVNSVCLHVLQHAPLPFPFSFVSTYHFEMWYVFFPSIQTLAVPLLCLSGSSPYLSSFPPRPVTRSPVVHLLALCPYISLDTDFFYLVNILSPLLCKSHLLLCAETLADISVSLRSYNGEPMYRELLVKKHNLIVSLGFPDLSDWSTALLYNCGTPKPEIRFI